MRTEKRFRITQLAVTGVMTAVICILAPFSLPIGPVPVSFANLAIYIVLYILGMKRGTISYLIYLLIGLVGVPVFSGFSGGPQKLFGPTGGYLLGFIPMALIAGIVIDRYRKKWYLCLSAMTAGTFICYLFGTVWLAFQANMTFQAALAVGVIPFVPLDMAKIVLALMIGSQVRGRLVKAQLVD